MTAPYRSQSELVNNLLDKHIPCTCDPAYKTRGLAAPDCPRCSFGGEIEDAMTEYAKT